MAQVEVDSKLFRRLQAELTSHGYIVRSEALNKCSAIIGRPIKSRSELTESECSVIIDALLTEVR